MISTPLRFRNSLSSIRSPDTVRRYGSGPSSATAGAFEEASGGAVPPRECAAVAASPKMRMRDVVYATSRPSPSITWPADRPMVRPVWMARPLAVMTDPTRAGRRYVIDISAVVYCVCGGCNDCSAQPRAASAASANVPPRTAPRDHSNHGETGRLNAAVPASAPSNVSPVSRPIGGCARTRRSASRPLSSLADVSRISPRTGISRHRAGSRISTRRA